MMRPVSSTLSLMIAVSLTALTVACAPADASGTDAAAETATPAAEAAQPAAAEATPAATTHAEPPAIEGDYWTLRPRLLEAGFTPREGLDGMSVCPERMAGETYDGSAGCPSAEVMLPEVEACAGTGMGDCRIELVSPEGAILTIFTIGEPQPGRIRDHEWSGAEGAN